MTSDATETEASIPVAPRQLTARARSRSWYEQSVRIWMLLTGVVAIATAYFLVTHLITAVKERRLISSGVVVHALIVSIDEAGNVNRPFDRNEEHHLKLSYTMPDGKDYKVDCDIPPKIGAPLLRMGETIPIHVDPDDPRVVTTRDAPRSWLASLTVAVALVPLVPLLGIITLIQRAAVLRVWRDGIEADATVIDLHRTAMAPRSKSLRFSLTDGDDRRVYSTLYPRNAGMINVGDAIRLIMPAGNPARAVVAKLYC